MKSILSILALVVIAGNMTFNNYPAIKKGLITKSIDELVPTRTTVLEIVSPEARVPGFSRGPSRHFILAKGPDGMEEVTPNRYIPDGCQHLEKTVFLNSGYTYYAPIMVEKTNTTLKL